MVLKYAALVLICAGAVLAAADVRAGDDDQPPAYKIYIDPETGRYTTEDPLSKPGTGSVVKAAAPAPVADEADRSAAVLSLIVIAGVFAGAILLYRRQPST